MLAKDCMLPTTEVVHLDQSLTDAATRLRRFGLPALAVVDGDEIVGLLTVEAVEAQEGAARDDLAETAVRNHMSAEVAFCRTDESMETAHAIMRKGGHHHLLVVDGKGRLCGLLSASEGEADHPAASGATPSHTVKTPGRASGGELHQPPAFSVKPVIKK